MALVPNLGSDCFKYNFAIVSRIASSFAESSTFPLKKDQIINLEKARKEHEDLVESLRRVGLDVIELPSDDKHPDGVFVGDVAVVINGTALICNPPSFKDKPTRQGELAVVRQVLRKELGLKIVEMETEKALLEANDVLWTGREIFVGISERSNLQGAQMVAKAFPEYPTTVVKVTKPCIHLRDCIGMAGPEIMVIGKSESAQKIFSEIRNSGAIGYKYITVEEEEENGGGGAANVIYVNRTLLHFSQDQIPKGAAVYLNKIDYSRVSIAMEEPTKRGGYLSNCILLINKIKHPKKLPTTIQ